MATASFNPVYENAFFFGYSAFDHTSRIADQLTLETCTAILSFSDFANVTGNDVVPNRSNSEISILLGRYAA
jgi:hypothetical protein